mmetsp:Transcript_35239/g.76446  ORF Transcript_35239/g.76446 Transcript_35239/m.76446 type:complete len:261 (-) Transcript_35239:177-959(-)
MTLTPLWSMTLPGTVTSQLPPASAARSTMTEPGFMDSTISLRIRRGAGLPGIRAVVTMTSISLHCARKSAISASMNSLDISLAYPPWPSPDSSMSTVRNSAPIDLACSLTASLVSKTRTTAPKFLAWPVADSPATPPPITRTLAGGTRPAAVIWPAKKRPKWCEASMMARYPAMLAIELRVSKAWARLITLGMQSRARTVAFFFCSWSTRSLLMAGRTYPTRVLPSPSLSTSSPEGSLTLMTRSLVHASLPLTILAPLAS